MSSLGSRLLTIYWPSTCTLENNKEFQLLGVYSSVNDPGCGKQSTTIIYFLISLGFTSNVIAPRVWPRVCYEHTLYSLRPFFRDQSFSSAYKDMVTPHRLMSIAYNTLYLVSYDISCQCGNCFLMTLFINKVNMYTLNFIILHSWPPKWGDI